MQTRDQQYAEDIYKKVQQISEKYSKQRSKIRSYGAMSHKLPILIHTAGLVQALTFVDSRTKNKDKDKGVLHELLDDLATTVGKANKDALLRSARSEELTAYILLTQQVLDALVWYKRFAQSLLGVDASDRDTETDGDQ